MRGRAGYTITGWPWPLTTFEVDTRPAYAFLRDGSGYEPRIRAMAKLTRIDLFAPFITGEVEGGYNYLVVEAYTSYGPRARLGLHVRRSASPRAAAARRLADRAPRLSRTSRRSSIR